MGQVVGIRKAFDRRFCGPDGLPRERLDTFARAFRIVDPLAVELVGTGRHALITFTRIDQAGIAAVQQLEQVVFALAVLAEVADQALRQSGHRSR